MMKKIKKINVSLIKIRNKENVVEAKRVAISSKSPIDEICGFVKSIVAWEQKDKCVLIIDKHGLGIAFEHYFTEQGHNLISLENYRYIGGIQ